MIGWYECSTFLTVKQDEAHVGQVSNDRWQGKEVEVVDIFKIKGTNAPGL